MIRVLLFVIGWLVGTMTARIGNNLGMRFLGPKDFTGRRAAGVSLAGLAALLLVSLALLEVCLLFRIPFLNALFLLAIPSASLAFECIWWTGSMRTGLRALRGSPPLPSTVLAHQGTGEQLQQP